MTSTTAPPRPDFAGDGRPRPTEPRGFRPASRRRTRVAAGAVLAAVAIGGNVLLYTSLDHRTEVLQAVTDIRAGDPITAEQIRVVEVDLDPTVPVVRADDLALVAGQYASVHIASGSLLAPVLLQPEPLVSPDTAVVAVELRPTLVPNGLRERSLVELIVVDDGDERRATGRVVTRPIDADGVSGVVTMSVEVATADAAGIASGDDLRVVLLQPGRDPVYADRTGS